MKGFGYLSRRRIIQKLKNYSINENITVITTDDEQFEQVEEEMEDPSVNYIHTSLFFYRNEFNTL